jgi:hypothetical protein
MQRTQAASELQAIERLAEAVGEAWAEAPALDAETDAGARRRRVEA